jgi:hypothetical protein
VTSTWTVVEESVIERFLACGYLHQGFARIYCDQCGHDKLLAVSCKICYVCPNCDTDLPDDLGTPDAGRNKIGEIGGTATASGRVIDLGAINKRNGEVRFLAPQHDTCNTAARLLLNDIQAANWRNGSVTFGPC